MNKLATISRVLRIRGKAYLSHEKLAVYSDRARARALKPRKTRKGK